MSSDIYLKSGLQTVEGWLNPFCAKFIAGLSTVQRNLGVTGSVGEIGVHHGKLFILLHCDADKSRSFAIDVFDEQHLNVDQSGKGNYEKFVQNVVRWCGPTLNIEIIKSSSFNVTPAQLKSAVGDIRIFSIDGGHTQECTINDIDLAESTIGEYGVVVLDDVFNPHWPGVMSGIAQYLMRDGALLRPFAISPGKVYLARAPAAEIIRRDMSAMFRESLDKASVLFQHEVDIYGFYDEYYQADHPIKYKIIKPALEKAGLFNALSSLRARIRH